MRIGIVGVNKFQPLPGFRNNMTILDSSADYSACKAEPRDRISVLALAGSSRSQRPECDSLLNTKLN